MATVSPDSVAQDQIKAFIERIERLEEERKAIAGDIAEVYAEAKGNGFDRKALKAVVRIRAQDHASRMEHEALVELYLSALGMAPVPDEEDEPEVPVARACAPARAHVENIDEIPAAVLSAEPNGADSGTTAVAADSDESEVTSALVATDLPVKGEDRSGADRPQVPTLDPAPVAKTDYSKPNPICQDPEDCGVHASWNHTCGSCLRRRATIEAGAALQ